MTDSFISFNPNDIGLFLKEKAFILSSYVLAVSHKKKSYYQMISITIKCNIFLFS